MGNFDYTGPRGANVALVDQGPVGFWDGIKAAWRREKQVGALGARGERAREALLARHRQIERAAGQRVPMTGDMVGLQFQPEFQATGTFAAGGGDMQVENEMILRQRLVEDGELVNSHREYEARIEKLRAERPDSFARAKIQSRAEFSVQLDRDIRALAAKYDDIIDRSPNPLAARLLGGGAAAVTDPINLAVAIGTGGVGAGWGLGARVTAQVALGGATEAVLGLASKAEAEVFGGPEVTWGDVAINSAAGAVFGGVFELGGEGVSRLLKRTRATPPAARAARIEAIKDVEARILAREVDDDIELDGLFADLSGEDVDLARHALVIAQMRAELGDASVARPDLPGDVMARPLDEVFDDPDVPRLDTGSQVLRRPAQPLEDDIGDGNVLDAPADPGAAPDPVAALDLPDAPPGAPVMARTDGVQQSIDYQGRAIHQGRFDPADIQTDAKAFQYKADGDADGVTARLKDVRQWDPVRSGKAVLYEQADGTRFIADGHQRLGLAKRLGAAGDRAAQLDGYLFRELDGWSREEVRVVAALKNISEGSGTAIDAAKVFRQAGDAVDGSLPGSGAVVRDGRGLAALSDEAFGQVVNEVASVRDGAIVGRVAAGVPDLHVGLLNVVRGGGFKTGNEVEMAVRDLLKQRWVADAPADTIEMFDVQTLVPHLFYEKIQAMQAVTTALKSHRAAFAHLVENADLYETAGNLLARDVNEQEAHVAQAAAARLSALADHEGPIKEALREASEAIAKGVKPAQAVRPVVAALNEAVANRPLHKELLAQSAPSEADLAQLANEADGAGRLDVIGEEAAPMDVDLPDDQTFDMFGDLKADQAAMAVGPQDVARLATCGPLKGG